MIKNNPIKSVKSGLLYGVPAAGAGKFGAALSGLLWPRLSGIADALNSFGILQFAGLPENVQIDQSWIASICALGGAIVASFAMSQFRFYWRRYVGVKDVK